MSGQGDGGRAKAKRSQPSGTSDGTHTAQPVGRARGLVSSRVSGSRIDARRIAPPADLADVVETFWIGRWELPAGERHTTELLGDPCVHLVVEGGHRREARVVGVWTRLWRRTLEGSGWVRGVKLRPGAVRAFLQVPAASVSNRIVPWNDLFDGGARELQGAVETAPDDVTAFERYAVWLRQHRNADPNGDSQLATRLVARAVCDAEIVAAESLAHVAGLGLRSLQRLFHEHVGASPKWVIRRHRLQEVALRLEQGERRSLAALAAELGYTDQAHLTRDFKSAVGKSPRQFATLVHK